VTQKARIDRYHTEFLAELADQCLFRSLARILFSSRQVEHRRSIPLTDDKQTVPLDDRGRNNPKHGGDHPRALDGALTGWKTADTLRPTTPFSSCDQDIQHLNSAALPPWVENWVENRRCPESANAGAA
jgi:hypothetical protein